MVFDRSYSLLCFGLCAVNQISGRTWFLVEYSSILLMIHSVLFTDTLLLLSTFYRKSQLHSSHGTGAEVEQNGHPVLHIPRRISPAEKGYSPTQRQVSAVLWIVRLLHEHLFGSHFTIITDHDVPNSICNPHAFLWKNPLHLRFNDELFRSVHTPTTSTMARLNHYPTQNLF